MRAPVDYRAMAAELVEFACGGPSGRPEQDPVYQAVVEGRDRPPYPNKYSSCGDLAHWMLYRLGVRLPWINRAEHLGWTSGVNVSRLAFDSGLFVSKPSTTERFKPGDIGIVWSNTAGTDAHVFVFLDDQQPTAIFVAEYGQPGGKVNTRRVGYYGGLMSLGVRGLYRVLRLDAVIDAADAGGFLEQPETADMWARRVLPELYKTTDPPPEAA
ncbi:MAG TPA: hypothetical protein VFZ53_10355 [Polyangiaceae bacterium]